MHTGKQHHRGRACGRDFVRNPGNHSVPEEQCLLIKRLLLENISLRGISRAAGVGLRRLYNYGSIARCVNASRGSRVHLPFSKKLSNHIGAIKYFICDDNLTKCAALPG